MLMSCQALLDRRNQRIDATTVKQAISGNLCRCGTYPNIVAAVLAAAKSPRGA